VAGLPPPPLPLRLQRLLLPLPEKHIPKVSIWKLKPRVAVHRMHWQISPNRAVSIRTCSTLATIHKTKVALRLRLRLRHPLVPLVGPRRVTTAPLRVEN
jgi:hypothetical protein